jgi:hypothetical protein
VKKHLFLLREEGGTIINQVLKEAIEKLKKDTHEYFNLFDEYRNCFIKSDLLPQPLQEAVDEKETQELLKDLNKCVNRITKDVTTLKILLQNKNVYSKEEIKEVNSNLVDLIGTSSTVNTRYSIFLNKTKELTAIHSSFLQNIEMLNNLIIGYNKGKEYPLCTIQQAMEIFNKRRLFQNLKFWNANP